MTRAHVLRNAAAKLAIANRYIREALEARLMSAESYDDRQLAADLLACSSCGMFYYFVVAAREPACQECKK